MKKYLRLVLLVVAITCLNCANNTSADSLPTPEPAPTPQIFRAEAKIRDGNLNNVAKITETIFNAKENNRKIYFVDKEKGWLISNAGNLYKTENGGKNWTKISLNVGKDASINTIVFANQSVGWLNIQKIGDVNENDTKSWLMKTVDGGKNWQPLSIQKFTEIDDIYFKDEKNGWLIGETNNPENVYDGVNFLRKTTDGGISWTEIGDPLFNQNGFEDRDARQTITGFIAETPEKLKVVMWSGKMFETIDGGKSWQKFGPQFDFPDQTVPDNFGQLGNSDRLRMARGTWSIEGIYSYVATEENGDWTIRWTDEPVCFFDIAFISEKEMLAVGKFGENIYQKNQALYGVVLHSADAGANWKIIYRNKNVPEINSLAKIADDEFLAVGEKGLVLNIKLTK